ncbi:MAG TPA: D-2-hydroxyacid dehydrogenase [Trueperaceae bacterium]|mgnify:FL=1|nr:D-2-hydroxyacid dehydrogenase [Trueperaceae bacterium]
MKVLICSYLEPELIARISAVDERLDVQYHPELLPQPRYLADHVGAPLKRSAADQARWEALLQQADVLFDFDYTAIGQLPERAPSARWLQATSAGIGQLVKREQLDRMNAVFTTASGVHARPLAEFVMMILLEQTKRAALARQQQQERLWKRFATGELAGKTLAIVGYGNIGQEVARLARPFGMRVTGSKRRTEGFDAGELGLDALYSSQQLHEMLAEADFVCLITPHTPDTEGLMNDAALAATKRGATLINIARGVVVDEPALVRALDSGQLGHAALDVAAREPLPADSPLWAHPNITIYPHSASTGEHENERIVDLFCENLRRYLANEPLLNQLDVERMY